MNEHPGGDMMPRHDPLETEVTVSEDTRTVSLWIDGYEIAFGADPADVEYHVDLLARISAAAGHAVKLLRSPQARSAAVGHGEPPKWLDETQVETRVWPPTRP